MDVKEDTHVEKVQALIHSMMDTHYQVKEDNENMYDTLRNLISKIQFELSEKKSKKIKLSIKFKIKKIQQRRFYANSL